MARTSSAISHSNSSSLLWSLHVLKIKDFLHLISHNFASSNKSLGCDASIPPLRRSVIKYLNMQNSYQHSRHRIVKILLIAFLDIVVVGILLSSLCEREKNIYMKKLLNIFFLYFTLLIVTLMRLLCEGCWRVLAKNAFPYFRQSDYNFKDFGSNDFLDASQLFQFVFVPTLTNPPNQCYLKNCRKNYAKKHFQR